jgi:hypothetical protein
MHVRRSSRLTTGTGTLAFGTPDGRKCEPQVGLAWSAWPALGTVTPMTLVEFMRARLDDDERAAENVHHYACDSLVFRAPRHSVPCDCSTPGLIRAEVDVQRRIVEMYRSATEDFTRFDQTHDEFTNEATLETVVRLLALPYANHPDYQQEWKT